MGRDTIQLDDAVSTISGEYLLEFTSEYGIPEDLHPELPGPEDTIVDFSEGKVESMVAWRTGAPKDGMPPADSYSALDVTTLNTRRTPIQKQPELLLCLVALSRRYFLGDDVDGLVQFDQCPESCQGEDRDPTPTPSTVEKSPLDFADEDLPLPNTEGVGTEEKIQDELSREILPVRHTTTAEVIPKTGLEEEVATMGPPVNKRRKQMRHKRANDEAEANAPPKVLRKNHVSSPAHSAYRGKSLAAMGLGAGSISSTPSAQGAPTTAKSVSDPDPLSYAKPQPYPEQDIAQSFRGTATEIPTEHVATTKVNVQLSVGSPESGKSISVPSVVGSPGVSINQDFLSQYNMKLARKVAMGSELRLRFEQEVRATETEVHGLRNQTKNLETLLEAEADMKKAAEAKNAELTKELESLHVWFSYLQVNNNQLSQQVSNLQAQITGEEKIKAAFEEFKKYENARVEQRCTKMDARLDALSIDFDEELYPHMLTVIAGRRWVIGHGIRLAVMKCAELTKLRQVFANVNEGLKYSIEHGKASRDLVDVEAYDPKANDKLVKALQDLKDLKYPMVDQLERLKDAPVKLIMASLHLEGDTGEDAPQRIRDLRPSSSQLKIPVYPEVRNPKDPWAVKEEMLLEDAIAANISRAENKKKCRVVCHTHGIGTAHHARSDGIHVSAPTVVPQGIAILLADAATQTEAADKEEEPYPRLQRSILLPHVYNL
ncbi:hypothetical protein Tco_0420348 [Tanacetum coccineum]